MIPSIDGELRKLAAQALKALELESQPLNADGTGRKLTSRGARKVSRVLADMVCRISLAAEPIGEESLEHFRRLCEAIPGGDNEVEHLYRLAFTGRNVQKDGSQSPFPIDQKRSILEVNIRNHWGNALHENPGTLASVEKALRTWAGEKIFEPQLKVHGFGVNLKVLWGWVRQQFRAFRTRI